MEISSQTRFSQVMPGIDATSPEDLLNAAEGWHLANVDPACHGAVSLVFSLLGSALKVYRRPDTEWPVTARSERAVALTTVASMVQRRMTEYVQAKRPTSWHHLIVWVENELRDAMGYMTIELSMLSEDALH